MLGNPEFDGRFDRMSATTTDWAPDCRRLVASGRLGPHDGLPVSIVKVTTLTEVEAPARCYRCSM